MREKYAYRVHVLNPDGTAIVEYAHQDYGKITVHMILEYDQGLDHIHRKIVEQFPRNHFYSNMLREKKPELPSEPIMGGMEIDLDDYFYDVVDFSSEEESS